MISSERPLPHPYGRQPYGAKPYNQGPRPQIVEETLDRGVIQIDRKTFTLVLKENQRGRFLRITEECGEFRTSIMIPITGLEDFYAAFVQMVEANIDFPPANKPGPLE
jgi:hypothetical protein